ncbi:MAG TPA: hypothetical protein VGD62_11095, partial [Acidobacteriaceae bacterium]
MTPLETLIDEAPGLAETGQPPATPPPAQQAPVRIGFISLGCPKNLVDSEVMMGMLAQAGAQMTTSPETADVLIV